MEKEKLPNSTLILVFGIISIVSCCCYGLGLIFGITGLVLSKKATAQFIESPELYTGYSNVKTGRVLSIIGIVLSILYLVVVIGIYAVLGEEKLLELQQEMLQNNSI